MTLRLPVLISFALLALLAAAAPHAGAAETTSDNVVIEDWRNDGSIDGKYSASQLRTANGQVSAAEREYYNWDEAYAAALAKLAGKPAPKVTNPKPLPPGADPERAPGGSRPSGPGSGGSDDDGTYENPDGADSLVSGPGDDEGGSAAGAAGRNDKPDDGGLSTPLVLVILALLAIAGVTGWRLMRGRGADGPGPDGPGPDVP